MNRREVLAIVALLAAIILLGLAWPAPHAAGDTPARQLEALVFEPVSIPQNAGMQMTIPHESVRSSGGPSASGQSVVTEPAAPPAPSASPSLRAVPRLAAASRTSTRTGQSVTGTASTYGPGFDGYLALPAGPGIHVRICGVRCIDRVSNDKGPVASLHRVADLNVADFEYVCGLPWARGLCRVSVEVLAP